MTNMHTKSRTVTVDYDGETDEYIIPLPQDMCDELGWKTDDVLVWTLSENGGITINKKE